MKDLEIVLSTFARFHAYQVAVRLGDRGSLKALFVGDRRAPPKEVGDLSKRFWPVFALMSGFSRTFGVPAVEGLCVLLFDRWVASHLPHLLPGGHSRIFHGFSLYCLSSLISAKALGVTTVVERAGSHILAQKKVVEVECEAFGGSLTRSERAYFGYAARMMEEYERADYILTCSEYARRSFLEYGISHEKIISIPLGTNFSPGVVEIETPKPFRVLCIGGDFYRKGIMYLLRAWKLLRLQDAELLILTFPPRQHRELWDVRSVRLLAPGDWSKLTEYYKTASVFALPSVEDGFGMVVLEAMAHGLPVIVSSYAGASEVVRHGVDGLVFAARDVEKLAEYILCFYRDRDKAVEMGRRAIERAAQFSWERYAESLLRFYVSAVKSSGR